MEEEMRKNWKKKEKGNHNHDVLYEGKKSIFNQRKKNTDHD